MVRSGRGTGSFGVLAGSFLWLAGASMASAQMYGTGYTGTAGPTTFYTINPTTGVATPVGQVGFNRCGGMDVGPGNVVFATCETAAAVPVLITINPATGAGTQVGPTGITGAVSDISFRGDGVLFAYDASNDPTHTLFRLDTATGASTLVGDTGLSTAPGNAMSFDLGGTLFHSQTDGPPDPELNTLNQTTGQATFVVQLPIPGGCAGSCRFAAMDADPVTGQMVGLLNDGARRLATINTVTGALTIIGPTAGDLDAIAFSVFVPVELQGFSVE